MSRVAMMRALVAVLPVLAARGAFADQITVPHTFVNGTPADAIEVNENFDTIVDESNAQDLRIGAVEDRLTIQLVSHQGGASPGGTGLAWIVVAVNNASGPVTGLTIGNFSLFSLQTPPTGPNAGIAGVSSAGLGFYSLGISPVAGTWVQGRYSFGVKVDTTGPDVGGVVNLDIAP